MKQDEYSTARLDTEATEFKLLNPGGPDQRQHQAAANLIESFIND